MSEWITDRLPTEADSDMMNKVWVWEDNAVYWSDYSVVNLGTPWMPNKIPAPYVKPEPQRWKPQKNEWYWTVNNDALVNSLWGDDFIDRERFAAFNCFQTQAQAEEAARRVRQLLLNYHKELNNE
jgi:hypothetical protein